MPTDITFTTHKILVAQHEGLSRKVNEQLFDDLKIEGSVKILLIISLILIMPSKDFLLFLLCS